MGEKEIRPRALRCATPRARLLPRDFLCDGLGGPGLCAAALGNSEAGERDGARAARPLAGAARLGGLRAVCKNLARTGACGFGEHTQLLTCQTLLPTGAEVPRAGSSLGYVPLGRQLYLGDLKEKVLLAGQLAWEPSRGRVGKGSPTSEGARIRTETNATGTM